MLLALVWILLPWCDAKLPAPEVIRWARPPSGYYNNFIYDVLPGKEIILYGGWRNPTLVVLIDPKTIKLKIDCRIDRLPKTFALRKMKLCFETAECTTLGMSKDDKATISGLEWNVAYDNFTGSILSVEIPKDKTVKKIFCQAENEVSKIETNKIYIEDNRERFDIKPLKLDVKAVVPNWSYDLNCRKFSNVKIYRFLRYEWFISDSDKGHFQNLMSIAKNFSWPVQIYHHDQGKLYWPYIWEPILKLLKGKFLTCKVEGVIAAVANKGLEIGTGSKIKKPELRISKQLYSASIIPSKNYPSRITCNFEIGPGSYNVSWFFNGKQLQEGLNKEEELLVSGSELAIIGPSAGELKCAVRWTKRSGNVIHKDAVVLDTSSSITPVPQFSKKLPFYVYAVNKGNVSVVCPVALEKKKNFDRDLRINGRSILSDSINATSKIFKDLRTETKLPIFGMVEPLPKKEGKPLTYTATKMEIANLTRPSSAHSLQCILKSEDENISPFDAHQYVILSAISEPVISKMPSNCSNCNFCIPQMFTCSLKNRGEVIYEGMKVNYKWFLLDHLKATMKWTNVTNYPDVFKISRIGNAQSILTISGGKEQLQNIGVKISEGVVTSSLLVICTLELRNTYTNRVIFESDRQDLLRKNFTVGLEGIYKCPSTHIGLICAIVVFVIFYIFVIIIGMIIIFAYRNILPNTRVILAVRSRLLNKKLMMISTPGTATKRPPVTWEVILMVIIGLLLVPVIIGIYIIILAFTGRGVIPIKSV